MNLLGIQDALKNASDQQLMQLMRAPDSTAPSYLVVSELNRRKQMRAKQAEPPSRTVAEDLTSEENMQAPMGIRSLQTPEPGDEDYPTEEEAPGIEAMREGGIVRMSEGTPDGVQGEEDPSLFRQLITPTPPSDEEMRFRSLRRTFSMPVNPLNQMFGGQREYATNRDNLNFLDQNREKFLRGELDFNAFERNPAGYRASIEAGIARPPVDTQPLAPIDPGSTPPVTQPQGGPTTRPAGNRPGSAGGIGGPAARPAAQPAAQPEAMPTLQQTMERNLGMFPGIPQELLDRIKASRTNEGDRRREAQNMALLEAGLRIAGSNNPRLAGAIGEGAAPAVQTYNQQLRQIREDQNADLTRELSVAQADLQRRYMAGQISASEYQRLTQLQISRDDRAARLEAARISAGSAAANTEATLRREQFRADQAEATASRGAVERSVREALGDMGRVATVTTALKRTLGRDPTRDEVVGAITNEAIERNREISRAFTRLNTGNTPRANSEVVRP